MAEGKPKHRDAWKARYRLDLEKAELPGGETKKRGTGKTKPGHLAPLLAMPLTAFGPGVGRDTVEDWYAIERKRGSGVQAKRAAAMFAGFLSWVDSCKQYRGLVDPTCARASKLRNAPAKKNRTDAIEQAQLPAWFAAADKLLNRTAATYLQVLLFIGARRNELATLTWANVDFRWKKLTIADKVDDTRTIPLTPFVAYLLGALPRTNEYVFASTGKLGRIAEPRGALETVLADAAIPHVSIHGLRRTFSLLGEAAGAPAGAIAQIMGHKPSAIAEGYRPRSIDALRPYIAQIEAFILEKAEIQFDATNAIHGALRVVK
jgi:integrase